MNATMKTVYVVAFEYESGGGFNWYHTAEAAERAYQAELANCDRLTGWSAYRFNYETENTDADAITAEIDGQLIELCEAATIKRLAARPSF